MDDTTSQVAAAERRLAELLALSSDLSRSVTVADVAEVVLRRAAGTVDARGAALVLTDDEVPGQLRVVAQRSFAPRATVVRPERFAMTAPAPLAEAVLTGEVIVVASPSDAARRYPLIHGLEQLTDDQAWVILPLVSTGLPFGSIGFSFAGGQDFDDSRLAFLMTVANQCAQALERAQMFEREHTIADLLQRSFLPSSLPLGSDLEFAGVYRPATLGSAVGGDWYDVFVLPDERVVMVVGDVMGKGVPAAAVMGQIRNAIRSYALIDADPAFVLGRVDHLYRTLCDDEFITFVYAVFDPDAHELSYANAGHLPPVHVGQGGVASLLGDHPEPPVGLADQREAHRQAIGPGDVLVLYTDGLVERRSTDISERLESLRLAASPLPGESLEQFCHGLVDLFTGDAGTDDVAILAVRCHR